MSKNIYFFFGNLGRAIFLVLFFFLLLFLFYLPLKQLLTSWASNHSTLKCKECVRCFFRWPDCEKDFSQWGQPNGLSPVCDLWWVFRLPHWKKDFPHCKQVYSFSLVWILVCFLRVPDSVKDLSHWRQSVSQSVKKKTFFCAVILDNFQTKMFISETTSFHYFSPRIPNL